VLQVFSTIEKGAAEAAIEAAAAAAEAAAAEETAEATEEGAEAETQAGEPEAVTEEDAEAAEQTNEIEVVVVSSDGDEDEEQAEAAAAAEQDDEEGEAVAASEEEAEREDVYLLHTLVLETDLQEPDDVTTSVWFYNAVDDVWVTSESLYAYDHKEGTLQLVLQPGYTKAAIVTVQHKGVAGYLRTVQNKILKLM
jgi:hypothetical protein